MTTTMHAIVQSSKTRQAGIGDLNMRAALCHHYDVIRSRDVIGHVTIRFSISDFLYVLNINQIRISLCFCDVITDTWIRDIGDPYPLTGERTNM